MPDQSMRQEIGTIHRERFPVISQIADLARERYVQAIAGGIWAINAGYNFFVEKQDTLTSILHSVTNPANTPLFTPQFQGEIGKLGAVSQGVMYFVVAGAAVGATSVVLDNRRKWREGRGTITRKNSVILADCDGLPLLVDLGQQLIVEGQLGNVVLSKTAESPERTIAEQGIFKVWIANAGGAEKDFFDTSFWRRSGAKDANAIVLSSSNTTSAEEASVVIREQLANKKAAIVIISNSPDKLPLAERNERTDAYLVNPYIEITKRSVMGLLNGETELFIPQIDETAASAEYREVVEKKRESLSAKLATLKGKSEPVKIFLNGDLQGEEGRGLFAGLSRLNRVLITDNPEEADVVYYFGSGKITDDSSVMVEDESEPFRNDETVIKLRIPFDRDNEDNALGHGDGTISFERATNARLTEILKFHVEYQLSLKDRLSKIFRKGFGARIRRQVIS